MSSLHHHTFKDMMNDVVDYGSCCECGSAAGLPAYDPQLDARLTGERLAAAGVDAEQSAANIEVAYAGAHPAEVVGYIAGQPIPGDPGPPPSGAKRRLPPPLAPEAGGAPPGWTAPRA